jgi:hypothetical protein
MQSRFGLLNLPAGESIVFSGPADFGGVRFVVWGARLRF